MAVYALVSVACSLPTQTTSDSNKSLLSPTCTAAGIVINCTCGSVAGKQTCDDEKKPGPCVCADGKSSEGCGNGVLDPGEACDDGKSGGNGCDAKCEPEENSLVADTCPGQLISLWEGSRHTLNGSLDAYRAHSLIKGYEFSRNDRVYQLNPQASGTVVVSAQFGSTSLGIVEVQNGACSGEFVAGNTDDSGAQFALPPFQVIKGRTYSLIVAGEGNFSLGLTMKTVPMKAAKPGG